VLVYEPRPDPSVKLKGRFDLLSNNSLDDVNDSDDDLVEQFDEYGEQRNDTKQVSIIITI
jgi:hypothetical protein